MAGRGSNGIAQWRHLRALPRPGKTPRAGRPRPVLCAVVTRVFSGIQPTGDMHLGNFIGAVQRWVEAQPEAGSPAAERHDATFCVVDLHAMTMPYDPAELTAGTRRLSALLLASGLDHE